MKPETPPPVAAPVTDDELHALIDGHLPPADRQAIEARLLQQPDASRRLADWRAQREALRALHAPVLEAPVPQPMRDVLLRTAAARRQTNDWWRWGGMAASVVAAFGLGWLSHGQWPGRAGAPSVAGQRGLAFAQQAAVAHVVYSPEVRHPVEVSASEQAHLVQWLSKRLGKPLAVPDLSAQGYQLMGGRLLPGDTGARAQFMYQDASGVRLTLYLGALDSGPNGTAGGETAFRFTDDGPVPRFYWVDRGFGYALAGPLPREALLALARAVHGQL
ncbi:MAG: anti-sigma factor [Burkholderiales bacterium RIFCSPLOWO2_12_67_14]|nr:MAG: anti-sigma factor [Burkholderiales bacterium RIFCSPLOWO2_12_67_14]